MIGAVLGKIERLELLGARWVVQRELASGWLSVCYLIKGSRLVLDSWFQALCLTNRLTV